jgi:diguanylate cyclase (GGDEF)-like protein
MPDFYTIYLLVMLFGLSNCVIWGAIVYRYRDLYAARYWLCASVAGVVGGLILSTQGDAGYLPQTVGGNTVIILGFWLNYIGLRRLHGDNPNLLQAGLLLAACSAAMLATFHLWYGRNPLYTLLQSLPLLLTFLYLLRRSGGELGAGITCAAVAVACISHWVIAGGNILLLTGMMPTLGLKSAAAVDLLVFLFAAVTWNFGFLISVIDHLHRDVERLANEDDLTGLANRRLFMKHLEVACGTGSKKSFSLMLFDLDRFKTINDSYGHAAGDAALRHAAGVFRHHLRPGDVFARLGGDEFGILLPVTGEGEATSIAERAIAHLKASPFQWRDVPLDITTSVGIASSRNNPVQPDVIMEQADRALYETKRRGRNGFTLHTLAQGRRPPGKVIGLSLQSVM